MRGTLHFAGETALERSVHVGECVFRRVDFLRVRSSARSRSRSQVELFQQGLCAETVMGRDVLQDTRQSSGFDGVVTGNHLTIFAIQLRGDANVRASLPGRLVAEEGKSSDKPLTVHVARQLHAARTSSRTKCNRMIFGACVASSK